ncbi:MAG: four helix bundle protein [Candidatus Curtissbacteria bacterium]|nr:four helix bundle protein [Candidatus Curtissbacteria bacterium]
MKNDKEKFKKEFKARIYSFILKLVKNIDSLPKDTSSQIFAKQILRSSTSIGANYIEAQAASSKKDFANFFHYALKSANETKFWLAILKDTGKMNKTEAEALIKELLEIANILAASLITIKGKNK